MFKSSPVGGAAFAGGELADADFAVLIKNNKGKKS